MRRVIGRKPKRTRLAFYTIEDPTCEASKMQRAANRLQLQAYLKQYAKMENTECLNKHAGRVGVEMGISQYRAEQWLLFMHYLHTWLPDFKEHVISKAHLEYQHFQKLTAVLRTIEPLLPEHESIYTVMPKVDAFLVKITTARFEHQALPRPEHLRRQLSDYLVRLNITGSDERDETCTTSAEAFPTHTPGLSGFTWIGPSDQILRLDQSICNLVNRDRISRSEAMHRICNENAQTSITLVGFAETAHDPTPTHIVGVGELAKDQQAKLTKLHKHYHSITKTVQQLRDNYVPTAAQCAVVRLRDGTCRYPGCDRDALKCQMDHVINHGAGGWTSAGNLQSLCTEHHNTKTDRRIRTTMNEYGVSTWYFPDGRIAISTPTGILAGIRGNPKAVSTRWGKHTQADDNIKPPINNGIGRWGYTVNHKLKRLTKHLKRKPSFEGAEDIPF